MIASPTSGRRTPTRLLLVGVLLAGTVGLAACAGSSAAERQVSAPSSEAASGSRSSSAAEGSEPAPPAPIGTPAQSTRIRFVPDRVVLPGGASAEVQTATTDGGELKVPENVKHVGWWDGSAYAGDPFGNTVIAGHVDSATDGLGFFSRLLGLKKGETVTLRGDGHHLAYRITSIKTIKKNALATGSDTFDQTGDHRLVLITCGGAYRRDRGGYDSNVVVTAVPVGLAR